jgi:hypothetical protein
MCTGEVDRKVWMRPRLATLTRLGAAVDVLVGGAGETADHRVLGAAGDLADRLEIAVGGERIAGLDDVDAHVVQRLGDLQLLFEGHGGARALLAVAQGGVEDVDAVQRTCRPSAQRRGSGSRHGWRMRPRTILVSTEAVYRIGG